MRFYVDWDGDGDLTPDEDVGIVGVNVHNIPNEGGSVAIRRNRYRTR